MPASSVDLPASFDRHLRARTKSARTVETYLDAVARLDGFLKTRAVDLAGAGRVPEQPAPVLTEELLRRLLGTCAAAAVRLGSTICTRTCSGTPSPTCGCARAAGDRPDAPGGLEVPSHAAALRRLGRRRARPRRPPATLARRLALTPAAVVGGVGATEDWDGRRRSRRAHPCQAYPGDAFSSLEMPAHRRGVVDRGLSARCRACPSHVARGWHGPIGASG
jgi:hypothetical protein